MKPFVRGACLALLLAGLAELSPAQEIPKSEYIDYEPLTPPRIVRQTRASELFHLFGDPADPAYRDSSPRDGGTTADTMCFSPSRSGSHRTW